MEFRVVVEAQRNTYHAYCPNLKGCHSWGATVEEAMQYIEEALQFYVDNVDADENVDGDDPGFGYYTPAN
ncbi:MAG TPA: type II toxin-antitoxin system HicB family antitoxin [Armatimonadota bacterium]|jgi:predicted RNase H-like HicB family nuclease